jgi:hypothetical protein
MRVSRSEQEAVMVRVRRTAAGPGPAGPVCSRACAQPGRPAGWKAGRSGIPPSTPRTPATVTPRRGRVGHRYQGASGPGSGGTTSGLCPRRATESAVMPPHGLIPRGGLAGSAGRRPEAGGDRHHG